MQTHQADYFGTYRTMKMMRDANGVLVVEFHSNGGRCTFSAQHHTEVVDAFHRIAQEAVGIIGGVERKIHFSRGLPAASNLEGC
jgi:hypothetical protein